MRRVSGPTWILAALAVAVAVPMGGLDERLAAAVPPAAAAGGPAEPASPSAEKETQAPSESVAAAIRRALCRITVENAWGVPIALTDGFVLGKGRFVLTNLGPLAVTGAARARITLANGQVVVSTKFGMADASLGLVALHLPGKGATAPGLSLASETPALEGEATVFLVGRTAEGGVAFTKASLLRGPAIDRPAGATGTPTPGPSAAAAGSRSRRPPCSGGPPSTDRPAPRGRRRPGRARRPVRPGTGFRRTVPRPRWAIFSASSGARRSGRRVCRWSMPRVGSWPSSATW